MTGAVPRRLVVAVAAVLLVTVAAGCASVTERVEPESTTGDAGDCPPDAARNAAPTTAAGADPPTGPIRVLAAASLTEAFGDLAEHFETAHPGVQVQTSFGASSDLVAQLLQGAPADVLATADPTTMGTAVDAGEVTDPVTFACNTMTILTARGNPAGIRTLADLARPQVRFTLCAEAVPCGRSARRILDLAGVDAEPVGSEANVKAVVAKVASGEVDAGIVYRTDVEAVADRTDTVPIPRAVDPPTAYPIAVTRHADRPATAAAFVAFVVSDTGRGILADHGFEAR